MTTAAHGSVVRSASASDRHKSSHASSPPVTEATFRALLIGSAIAALFCAVNLHLGFKLGVGINLSIPSALLAFFSGRLLAFPRGQAFSILEANLAQTSASAGAAIAATGLVSAVPALTIISGYEWSWLALTAWLSSLGVLGVAAAVIVRRQLIEVERLPFALGVATAGLLREMYDRSGNAFQRVSILLTSAAGAGILRVLVDRWGALPIRVSLGAGRADQFGWAITFQPLLYAIGALIGLRVALSALLGALIAFGWLRPFRWGASAAEPIVWTGVTFLVVGSLLSLAIGLWSVVRVKRRDATQPTMEHARRERSLHVPVALVAIILVTTLQVTLFGVPLLFAIGTALAALLLAGVAGRVTGELAITPSGPLAKTAQIGFGLARPQIAGESLLAANVAGGAASQCGELIHDLKCGAMVGASWRWQSIAQLCGTTAGAAAGAALYLTLYPAPQDMLFTDDLPAPAVRSLTVVAELLRDSAQAVPPAAYGATLVAAAFAVLLTLLERLAPPTVRKWIPSPIAIGVGFLIPAAYSLALAGGALLGALFPRERAGSSDVCECGDPAPLDLAEICPHCGKPPRRGGQQQAPGLNRVLVLICIGIVIGQTFTELGMQAFRQLH